LRPVDPYAAFRFVVEVDGTLAGGFTEATGFDVETELEDYREGGVNDHTHKLAKHAKYPNLTLKRGLTDKDDLWAWRQDVVAGQVTRKTISVILRDASDGEAWRWVFRDAWPVKWSSSGVNASSSAVVVESVEFAHHGMSKV
jgi:phage tail-like protein